jgi:hypothetical protein
LACRLRFFQVTRIPVAQVNLIIGNHYSQYTTREGKGQAQNSPFIERPVKYTLLLQQPNLRAMSARDLLDDAALVDDDDDESFDEETGEVRQRTNGTNGRFDDSSEEDEDDDEEEAAKVSTPGSHDPEQPPC